jgi:NAD+ diphosphatase
MAGICAKTPAMIPFTGNPLNRLSEKRAEESFIAEKLHAGDSLVLPFFQTMPLIDGDPPAPFFLPPGQCGLTGSDLTVFLGMREGRAVFALDIGEDAARAEWLTGFGKFLDLRSAAPLLPLPDLTIASQGKGLLEWHARSKFCGRCGAPTSSHDGGNKRVCSRCGVEDFPRTDPAVIMLATHGEHCLLGRNVKWTPDFLSTLAGFVEPGESLEEAVARELHEEAGVIATSVRYFASQPWPFPAALMLGFFAEVESKALTLDPAEIAEALWFTKDEARALLAGTMPGRRGPSTAAIANFLIRAWAKK